MNYFPIGEKDKVNVMVDDEEVNLNKIEFIFSNYYNVQCDDLPYALYNGGAAVVNGRIHIFGGGSNGTAHYTLYGDRWVIEDNLPYTFNGGTAVVLNGELHLIGGGGGASKHYKWDGETWTQVSTLPYALGSYPCVVVWNNEIHILGGTYNANNTAHYKWSGTTWTQVSTLPYALYEGMAVVHKGFIHIMGGNDGSNNGLRHHYRWDGSTWVMNADLPVGARFALVTDVNNEMYIISPNTYSITTLQSIYKLNDANMLWKKISVGLPHNNIQNSYSIVPFRDEIHCLGGTSQNYSREHWKLAVKNYSMVVHK